MAVAQKGRVKMGTDESPIGSKIYDDVMVDMTKAADDAPTMENTRVARVS